MTLQEHIDRLKARMTPEKRQVFEEIEALRERIGPSEFFDIVEELRVMRGDSTPREVVIPDEG